jgi:YD repeat-containing protein
VRTYVGAGNATAAFLKQPDGSFVNTTIPTFRRGRITLAPETGRHTLRYKDGRRVLFGADPLPIQVRDRAGNTITIARDFETNPTQLTDPAGRSLALGWLWMIRDRVTMATDPLGRSVSYGYDTNNRLTSVTNPAGGITQYAYDSQHRMTSIADPRNIVTLQNAYDANSRNAGPWRRAHRSVVRARPGTPRIDPVDLPFTKLPALRR